LLLSTLCSAEITFKTDPKNTDYASEHGAQRNFEPWRDEKAVEEEDRLAKLEEEENNPMKVLENRQVDSKREMDVLDALQDIRARNARNERMGHSDDLLARIEIEEVVDEEDVRRRLEEEEDEKLVREVFSKIHVPTPGASGSGSGSAAPTAELTVKRKADQMDALVSHSTSVAAALSAPVSVLPAAKKKKPAPAKALGIKLVKKPKAVAPSA
jgi:hypothetical protein